MPRNSLLVALLDGPFTITARPEPVPSGLRLSWGMALIILLLGSSRGKKASLQKIHFLAHSVQKAESRQATQQVFQGLRRASTLLIRVDPWVSRALAFSRAAGLIQTDGGKAAKLTSRGVTVLEYLNQDASHFAEEKSFLAAVGAKATEAAVNKIMRMEDGL